MKTEQYIPLSDRAVWMVIAVVFLCVITILLALYNHEKLKPDSPHAVVAAAFNQLFVIQEWKPGMGPKPLMYHPAAQVRQQGGQSVNPIWPTPPPTQTQRQTQKQTQADGLTWHSLPRHNSGLQRVDPGVFQTNGLNPQ